MITNAFGRRVIVVSSRSYLQRGTSSIYTSSRNPKILVPNNFGIVSHQSQHFPSSHLLFSNIGSISLFASSNRPPPFSSNKGRFGILGTLGASAMLFGGKAKYLVGALKLTKFASLGSMIFTVGTYSMFYGLPYSIGMVGLILVHESGHALAMKQLGYPFKPMVFMPFVGASVAMSKQPKDAYTEAIIALAGPVAGSMGAVAVAGAAQITDSQLLFALADFGFMINLFNMLPIGFLDGGRICGALSPYAGVAGLGIGGSLIYMGAISNPIFYLVMLSGGYTTFQRFYNPEIVPLNYYNITPAQRAILTSSYFGLIGCLIGTMALNEKFKMSPEELRRRQIQSYSG